MELRYLPEMDKTLRHPSRDNLSQSDVESRRPDVLMETDLF